MTNEKCVNTIESLSMDELQRFLRYLGILSLMQQGPCPEADQLNAELQAEISAGTLTSAREAELLAAMSLAVSRAQEGA